MEPESTHRVCAHVAALPIGGVRLAVLQRLAHAGALEGLLNEAHLAAVGRALQEDASGAAVTDEPPDMRLGAAAAITGSPPPPWVDASAHWLSVLAASAPSAASTETRAPPRIELKHLTEALASVAALRHERQAADNVAGILKGSRPSSLLHSALPGTRAILA